MGVCKNTVSSFVYIPADLELVFGSLNFCFARELIISVCYQPPNSRSAFCDKLHHCFEEVVSQFLGSDITITGDFSLPGVDWSVPSMYSSCANRCERPSFVSICNEFNIIKKIGLSIVGRHCA